ncbi:MAG: hypothetical protein DRP59_03825 [Spirochaetes bacterium]|nr:MAG: hypothetical protein DRP59_03825 [Spirochaetota bacterium]
MIREAVKAASAAQAAELGKKGLVYLAGGTYVNWAESELDADRVVMLEGVIPKDITEKEGRVEIGALCTLTEITESSLIPEALRLGAGFIPLRNIRNMATIGGNIAANRADSYIIPVLLALKAEVETFEDGRMSVYDYVKGEKSSLILKVIIPPFKGKIVVDRSVRSSAAYPSATVAVSVSSGECIIALGCISDHVMRLEDIEKEVASGKLKTEDEVFSAVHAEINPQDSLKETGPFRRYIASTLAAHSVRLCLGEGV